MKITSHVLCLLVAAACNLVKADQRQQVATVVAVLDGDTVLLKKELGGKPTPLFYKFRLADVDAPELDQAFGESAKRALARMVLSRTIYVTAVATDSYRREIGWMVLQPDTPIERSINSEIVKQGWAWSQSRARASNLRELQQEARNKKLGLWAQSDAVPPWIWRKQKAVQRE